MSFEALETVAHLYSACSASFRPTQEQPGAACERWACLLWRRWHHHGRAACRGAHGAASSSEGVRGGGGGARVLQPQWENDFAALTAELRRAAVDEVRRCAREHLVFDPVAGSALGFVRGSSTAPGEGRTTLATLAGEFVVVLCPEEIGGLELALDVADRLAAAAAYVLAAPFAFPLGVPWATAVVVYHDAASAAVAAAGDGVGLQQLTFVALLALPRVAAAERIVARGTSAPFLASIVEDLDCFVGAPSAAVADGAAAVGCSGSNARNVSSPRLSGSWAAGSGARHASFRASPLRAVAGKKSAGFGGGGGGGEAKEGAGAAVMLFAAVGPVHLWAIPVFGANDVLRSKHVEILHSVVTRRMRDVRRLSGERAAAVSGAVALSRVVVSLEADETAEIAQARDLFVRHCDVAPGGSPLDVATAALLHFSSHHSLDSSSAGESRGLSGMLGLGAAAEGSPLFSEMVSLIASWSYEPAARRVGADLFLFRTMVHFISNFWCVRSRATEGGESLKESSSVLVVERRGGSGGNSERGRPPSRDNLGFFLLFLAAAASTAAAAAASVFPNSTMVLRHLVAPALMVELAMDPQETSEGALPETVLQLILALLSREAQAQRCDAAAPAAPAAFSGQAARLVALSRRLHTNCISSVCGTCANETEWQPGRGGVASFIRRCNDAPLLAAGWERRHRIQLQWYAESKNLALNEGQGTEQNAKFFARLPLASLVLTVHTVAEFLASKGSSSIAFVPPASTTRAAAMLEPVRSAVQQQQHTLALSSWPLATDEMINSSPSSSSSITATATPVEAVCDALSAALGGEPRVGKLNDRCSAPSYFRPPDALGALAAKAGGREEQVGLEILDAAALVAFIVSAGAAAALEQQRRAPQRRDGKEIERRLALRAAARQPLTDDALLALFVLHCGAQLLQHSRRVGYPNGSFLTDQQTEHPLFDRWYEAAVAQNAVAILGRAEVAAAGSSGREGLAMAGEEQNTQLSQHGDNDPLIAASELRHWREWATAERLALCACWATLGASAGVGALRGVPLLLRTLDYHCRVQRLAATTPAQSAAAVAFRDDAAASMFLLAFDHTLSAFERCTRRNGGVPPGFSCTDIAAPATAAAEAVAAPDERGGGAAGVAAPLLHAVQCALWAYARYFDGAAANEGRRAALRHRLRGMGARRQRHSTRGGTGSQRGSLAAVANGILTWYSMGVVEAIASSATHLLAEEGDSRGPAAEAKAPGGHDGPDGALATFVIATAAAGRAGSGGGAASSVAIALRFLALVGPPRDALSLAKNHISPLWDRVLASFAATLHVDPAMQPVVRAIVCSKAAVRVFAMQIQSRLDTRSVLLLFCRQAKRYLQWRRLLTRRAVASALITRVFAGYAWRAHCQGRLMRGGEASLLIARFGRGSLARRRLGLQWSARIRVSRMVKRLRTAKRLQPVCTGYRARKGLVQLRRKRADTAVALAQRVGRGYHERAGGELVAARAAVMQEQRYAAWILGRVAAALEARLFVFWRWFELQSAQRRSFAAIAQRIGRGFCARRRSWVRQQRKRRAAASEQRIRSLAAAQRIGRAFLVRMGLGAHRVRAAPLLLQRIGRGWRARHLVSLELRAIIQERQFAMEMVAAASRGLIARRAMKRAKSARIAAVAADLQRRGRGLRARRRCAAHWRTICLVACVQKIGRGAGERMYLQRCRWQAAVARMQRCGRAYLCRVRGMGEAAQARVRACGEVFQRVGRAFSERWRLGFLRALRHSRSAERRRMQQGASLLLQRLGRGLEARAQLAERRGAVARACAALQCAGRGMLGGRLIVGRLWHARRIRRRQRLDTICANGSPHGDAETARALRRQHSLLRRELFELQWRLGDVMCGNAFPVAVKVLKPPVVKRTTARVLLEAEVSQMRNELARVHTLQRTASGRAAALDEQEKKLLDANAVLSRELSDSAARVAAVEALEADLRVRLAAHHTEVRRLRRARDDAERRAAICHEEVAALEEYRRVLEVAAAFVDSQRAALAAQVACGGQVAVRDTSEGAAARAEGSPGSAQRQATVAELFHTLDVNERLRELIATQERAVRIKDDVLVQLLADAEELLDDLDSAAAAAAARGAVIASGCAGASPQGPHLPL